jgi:hypothetical protein
MVRWEIAQTHIFFVIEKNVFIITGVVIFISLTMTKLPGIGKLYNYEYGFEL